MANGRDTKATAVTEKANKSRNEILIIIVMKKLFLTAFVLLCLVSVSQAQQNLALNKVVTASSTDKDSPLKNAVDGDMKTRWSSLDSDPQWICVDLGALYDIRIVKIFWEGAYATHYKVETSSDASNWTTFSDVIGNWSQKNIITGEANARYVRIYGTQRATKYGYSIFELEIYDKNSLAEYQKQNIAFGKKIGTNTKQKRLARVVDGFYEVTGMLQTNEFVCLDLGASYSVGSMRITWTDVSDDSYRRIGMEMNCFPYKVEISADSATWVTLATKDNVINLMNLKNSILRSCGELQNQRVDPRKKNTPTDTKSELVKDVFEIQTCFSKLTGSGRYIKITGVENAKYAVRDKYGYVQRTQPAPIAEIEVADINTKLPIPKVGELWMGGIVLSIDETGEHGLLVETKNDFRLEGYSYMPDMSELRLMYNVLHKNGKGNFSGNYKSSEENNHSVKTLNFFDGVEATYGDVEYDQMNGAIRRSGLAGSSRYIRKF